MGAADWIDKPDRVGFWMVGSEDDWTVAIVTDWAGFMAQEIGDPEPARPVARWEGCKWKFIGTGKRKNDAESAKPADS